MAMRWQLCVCSLGILLLAPCSLSETFSLAGSPHPVVGVIGRDVVLPCQLSPRARLRSMDVLWRKIGTVFITVHKYSDEGSQDLPGEGYQTRTELFLQEFSSGNVSLKLKGLQMADAGTYHCFVRNPTWSQEATTELRVAGDIFPRVYPWLAAFWVLFTLVLIAAGVCAYLGYAEKRKASQEKCSKEEDLLLLEGEKKTLKAECQELRESLDAQKKAYESDLKMQNEKIVSEERKNKELESECGQLRRTIETEKDKNMRLESDLKVQHQKMEIEKRKNKDLESERDKLRLTIKTEKDKNMRLESELKVQIQKIETEEKKKKQLESERDKLHLMIKTETDKNTRLESEYQDLREKFDKAVTQLDFMRAQSYMVPVTLDPDSNTPSSPSLRMAEESNMTLPP